MRQSASVLFLATIAASAQGPIQSLAPPPSAPSFRVGTKLVQVEVVARDRNGPAAGLTKADFTLLDNGKPQEISVFSVKSTAAKSLQKPAVLPPGIVSNRVTSDGQTRGTGTVVLLDQKNITLELQGFAIQEVVRFVELRRKNGRIGIYTLTKDGVRAVQDLTDDTELLRRAVKSLIPQTLAYRTCGPLEIVNATDDCTLALLTERAMETKHAFEGIARHLANDAGRKTLVWITTSFPLLQPRPISTARNSNPYYDFTPDMKEAAEALNDSDIALYAVDAHALRAGGRQIYPPGFNTMDLMAETTGGEVFINTNGVAESVEAAVEDGDLVYTLGFYPAEEEKEGAAHKLKVEVARKGLSLRYRESYVAAKPAAAIDPKTVQQLLKDSLDATEIELAARAIPDTAHPGSYRVQVSVNLHDVQFQHHDGSPKDALWTGQLGVALTVEGSEDIREITRKLEFRDDQLKAGIDRGTLVETSITTPPGSKGILRIAVQDQLTGAAGSVKVPFGGK